VALRHLFGVIFVAVVAATAAVVSPATAAKPAGGTFTTTVTISPTLIPITVGGVPYNVTVSGALDVAVTQFQVQDGDLVGVATVSGTLTASEPTLGTATLTIENLRVVLNADVDAYCSGRLQVDLQGVLQFGATLTLTTLGGESVSVPLSETIPRHYSFSFTATNQQLQSIICDIATLLKNGASTNALVDKLNTILKKR